MPTPLYDALLACKVTRASKRLRARLQEMRQMAPHAELLEPLLFPEVVEALRVLATSDEQLDRGQVEVTVSVRRLDGGDWRHFGTHTPSKMARSALEDFVCMRLPRADLLDELLNGEEVTITDFSYGAVTGRRLPSRKASRAQ